MDLPRQRRPMSERRCTCLWREGYASGRELVDPACPARVLHTDPTDAEVDAAVDRAVAAAGADTP